MKILLTILLISCSIILHAQLDHPKASPAASVEQEIGFTTIKIEYSRPATRGRKIFGDLVPYDRIWRVGANESTKIAVSTSVSVFGNALPAGTYALYAFPQNNEWEIVFHKNTKHWGDGRKKYNSQEDAFRVKVKPNSQAHFQENFLISFDNILHDSADMILHWENTQVIIPIKVATKKMMETQIEKALQSKPSAQTYYEVARYYVEEEINYDKALLYLNQAISLGGDTYYFHRVKSLAEAALNDYNSAIKSAKISLKLAQAQDKDEFVRMNQKNIDLWKTKLKK